MKMGSLYMHISNEYDEQGTVYACAHVLYLTVHLKCLAVSLTWKFVDFHSSFMGEADYEMPSLTLLFIW